MQSIRRKLSGLTSNQKIMAAALTITTIVSAFILTWNFNIPETTPEFYVGIEVAYGDLTDLKAIVTETKDYINLIVLGLPEVSKNKTLIDESCNYLHDQDLSFIVLFTNLTQYSDWGDYTPAQWVTDAKVKYGEKFVAVYRWDEAGGDQIDRSQYQEVTSASSYVQAAEGFVNVLSPEIQYYQDAGQQVLTADYGLYWFDYQAGYDTVLAEFGWNNSREQQIALVRGAARMYDKDWGAIVTWKYSNFSDSPYLGSGTEVFNDLLLAYNQGAKYAVVFNYPELETAQYGALKTEHLTALKQFWNYTGTYGRVNDEYKNTKVAYVLPENYGFGFRSASDTIWGLWGADSQAAPIYRDVQNMIRDYSANFDIIYNNSTLIADVGNRYETLIFWNGTTINP